MGRLLVVGSSNTDMILQVPHLPMPGETVMGGKFTTAAGGKGANQAVAAARAGTDVSLIARMGKDSFGDQALAGFASDGIDTHYCSRDPSAPSGVAQILVSAAGENCIGVAPGANATLLPEHLDSAVKAFRKAAVVLLQLETSLATVHRAAGMGCDAGALVILNPAPACELPDSLYPLLDMITPNESEAELLTGIVVSDEPSAAAAADILHQRGVAIVLITLGQRGVYLSRSDDQNTPSGQQLPAFTVEAVDSTAAGDVFNGCMAAALTRGDALETAVHFAQAAAALSVQTLGAQTSAPDSAAINTFLQTF